MVPKVSVIVPIYNGEGYIHDCLSSIVNQTYQNIEIIIVNDGSTDHSEEIVKLYQEEDSRIVYVDQDNSGPSAARNNGISHSTGEYIAFVDSDDTVDQDYIAILVNKMIDSGADLACCGYTDISEYGTIKCSDFTFEGNVSVHSFIEMVCKGTGGVLWSKLFKKNFIEKNKIQMDKKIFMSEDLVFVLQYAALCQSFVSVNDGLYNYNRFNQNSISANISMDYLENFIMVTENIKKILHSVDLVENKINEIIANRVQDFVVKIIEQQGKDLKELGMKTSIDNAKQILSLDYIKQYRDTFSTKDRYYKPFVFLIRNRLVRTSLLYGIILNHLRDFKKIFRKREQVGL